MPEVIIILCTCGSTAEADHIANMVVAEGLAACVNIVPGAKSVYRWQGKVEIAPEWLLFIKTRVDLWERLEKRILELHSYDTPELLRLPVSGGSEKYLAWIGSETAGGQS